MCHICKKLFKNKKGKTIHLKTCQKKRDILPLPPVTSNLNNNATQIDQTNTYPFMSAKVAINEAYESIVHWKRNIFTLPKGKAGKLFVREITDLINAWCDRSEWREISLKSIMIMPSLLLQKSTPKSKSHINKQHLERRLTLWQNGQIDDLLRECNTIQQRLKLTKKVPSPEETSRKFTNCIISGNINGALRMLSDENMAGILPMNDDTLELLKEKHPDGDDMFDEMLLKGPREYVDPIIFESIDADLIARLALNTKGSSGPSKFDADDWKRILVTKLFGTEGHELCTAIARMARQLCTEDITDTESITALMACRLIPLDKNPGLRPIGIGEILRRIIGKAVTRILRDDIQTAAGSLQLCAGQKGGCEAAIHSMVDSFQDDETHGIIQVDANNAFNTINRKVLLHNIGILCPAIYVFTVNCYKKPARLFVTGGVEIESREGSTQGDPISSPIYGIGITPLLNAIMPSDKRTLTNVAIADDITGAGKLIALRAWWDRIITFGKFIGYTVNASKSWLIVKSEYEMEAKIIFENTGIQITTEGHRQLGAVVGTNTFKISFVTSKVNEWVSQVDALSEIAKTEPHVAYAAFTHGLRHRYTFMMRTVPGISDQLKTLDNAINNFIRTLLRGYRFSDAERVLFSLPVKLGGLGIIIPSKMCDTQYKNSRIATFDLTQNVKDQNFHGTIDLEKQKQSIQNFNNEKNQHNKMLLEEVRAALPNDKLKTLDAISEFGASAWLSAIPIKSQGFYLNKQSFWDALRIRYNIPLERLPSKCVCGSNFNVDHALSCQKGGFIAIRHNEIRDITAEFLSEVCKDVRTEPMLSPVTGESLPVGTIVEEEARTDVSARGFWGRGSKAFVDIRIFNPVAKRYSNQTLSAAHKRNENEKKKKYNERIQQIEHGSFTPSCFLPTVEWASNAVHFTSVWHPGLLISEIVMFPP